MEMSLVGGNGRLPGAGETPGVGPAAFAPRNSGATANTLRVGVPNKKNYTQLIKIIRLDGGFREKDKNNSIKLVLLKRNVIATLFHIALVYLRVERIRTVKLLMGLKMRRSRR